MGTASRKTWLEKQEDKIQVEVLAMDDAGLTLEQIAAALAEKFSLKVPHSTLGNALKIYHDMIEIRAAEDWGAQLEKLIEENPHVQPAKLAKSFLTSKLAGGKFRDADMKAEDLVFYAQCERRMDLDERKVGAIEERNGLQKEKNNLERGRLEVARQQAEKDKRLLELKIEELERKRDAEKARIEELAEELERNAEKDPKIAFERIREIYGLAGHPTGSSSAVALPNPVGQ